MGLNIDKAIAKRGINQAELARRTGITEQALSLIHQKKSMPSTRILTRIANALDCDIVELFDIPERFTVWDLAEETRTFYCPYCGNATTVKVLG